MSITPLTVEPNSVTNPSGFSAEMDTHLAELNPMISQMNALAVSMDAVAAGGTAIPYTFSTTTTDADPGAGLLRLGNATQNAATVIRSDLVGSDGTTWTDLIDSFDDSTSTVKGQIILMNAADATKWLVFNLSSIASPTGYKNITVENVASSAASPFADGDSLLFKFTRTGDKGDTGAAGAGGALAFISAATASSSASIAFTGLDDTYDSYVVKLLNVIPATDGTGLSMRTSTNGGSSYDSGGSDYYYYSTQLITTTQTGASAIAGRIDLAPDIGNATRELGVSGDILIVRPSEATQTQIKSTLDYYNAATAAVASKCGAFRDSTADVDAIEISMASGNIASGLFALYGVKRS